ncbi:hypothetical protein AMAG_03762 [Allomyces macrogynus ATCC 38327]|uniref:Major facilitator superfamily (MFS) profile domain-containing protein n=1 Tax=Allomyces macrogynus (strain ATCC 38327) TaxID=578462 RepID=A0A0L0SAN4_ALLM3|nr:hypothetical protein AMAG_03762 [Allomyces macrogynus ATCC 38327]|eukprot:KNE59487.1 hypothetical protein AMAG_03762 [Allomyces macrogynus ATCC 38327]
MTHSTKSRSSSTSSSSFSSSAAAAVAATGPHERMDSGTSAASGASLAFTGGKPTTLRHDDQDVLLDATTGSPAVPAAPAGDDAPHGRHRPSNNSRRVYTSMAVIFVMATASSIVTAPQQQFMLRLVCREATKAMGLHGDDQEHATSTGGGGAIDPICQQPDVQRVVAAMTTTLALTLSIPTMFATSIYGRFSDNPLIGRRPFLVLPVLGYLLCWTGLFVVDHFQLSSYFLVPGNLLLGFSGDYSSFLMAYFALMTDLIPAPKRTYFFVLIELSLLLGLMLGPLIMSTAVSLAPDMLMLPMGMGMVLMVVALVLIMTLTPGAAKVQELRVEPVRTDEQAESTPFWSAVKSMEVIWTPWNRTRLVMIVAFFLMDLSNSGQSTLFVPYTYRRYGWTSKEDGLFQSVTFLAKVLVVLAFLPVASRSKNRWQQQQQQPRSQSQDEEEQQHQQPMSADPEHRNSETTPLLAQRDRAATPAVSWTRPWKVWSARYSMEARLTQAGIFMFAVTSVLYGSATAGWLYVAACPLESVSILSFPAMRSLLTQTVSASMIDTVLAAVSVVRSLAYILAPIVFNAVYAVSVGTVDGAVYFLGAALGTVAFAATLGVQRKDLVSRDAGAAAPEPVSVAAEREAENVLDQVVV